jgi:hypothetical protein
LAKPLNGRLPSQRTMVLIAPYALLPLLLFVLVPAYVLTQNEQDASSFDAAGILLLAGTAAGAAVLLWLIGRIEARLTTRRFFAVLVEFVLFFVLVTGFVLPASRTSTMIDPEVAVADVPHVIVASVLAFGMLLIAGTRLRASLFAAIVAFIGLNAILMGPAFLSVLDHPSSALANATASIFSLSRTRNILVLSFDGVPGSAVLDALKHDPRLRERFAGFTLYTGVASSSPATAASTATSLYGNQDYKTRYATERELWDSAPQRLMTNVLDENGWQVSTYGEYSRSFGETSRAFTSLTRRPPASVVELLNYALARSLTRLFVIGGDPGFYLDALYSDAMSMLTGIKSDAASRFTAAHLPVWKRGKLTPTVLDFEEYLKRVEVTTDEPVAHFLHFTHTHYPLEFDADCRWAAGDREWYMTHQNQAGLAGQAHCALVQMAEFIDRVRELDAFDRSIIILKSDHGQPVIYFSPDSIESFPIRNHPYSGYGSYGPMLAIKPEGPTSAQLVLDAHPVLLDDLAKTLCVHAGLPIECDAYGGYDLLGADFSGIEDDMVTMFVVRDDQASSSYDMHEAIEVRRGSSILASLHERLSARLIGQPVSCEGINAASGVPLDNGRSDLTSWLTWHDGASSFLLYRRNPDCPGSVVTIGEPRANEDDLAITVNGQSLTASSQSPSADRLGDRTVAVPAWMIEGSELVTVEVAPIDPTESAPVPIIGMAFEREGGDGLGPRLGSDHASLGAARS